MLKHYLGGILTAALAAALTRPKAALDDGRQQHPSGWRWAHAAECNESVLLEADADQPAEVMQLAESPRKCGVATVNAVLPASLLDELKVAVDAELAPLLASRNRLRAALQDGDASLPWHGNASLQDELLLRSGDRYRERDAGRIDLLLPWSDPFNSTALVANPLILSTLEALLGADFELKSVHGLHALPGAPDQMWHRDAPLLWQGRGVHHPEPGGLVEPGFAANVFVPLTDVVDASCGPTEFALGSHLWGEDWQGQWERCPKPTARRHEGAQVQFWTPRGSATISDYRTVHRGRQNQRQSPRTLLMLIYGRRWWMDPVNYDASYGGFQIKPPHAVDQKRSAVGHEPPASDPGQYRSTGQAINLRRLLDRASARGRRHERDLNLQRADDVEEWKRRGLLAGLSTMWAQREHEQ